MIIMLTLGASRSKRESLLLPRIGLSGYFKLHIHILMPTGGQETYGGVISTGGWSLIDGTFCRLPFRGWFVTDGTDMENNGAIPDILVPQTPEAESANNDEQLRAAANDLLVRL